MVTLSRSVLLKRLTQTAHSELTKLISWSNRCLRRVFLVTWLRIINMNLLEGEFLAPEKLCIILFGTGRLKITTKRHVVRR